MTIINFDKFSQKRCTIEMQEILPLFVRQKQFPTRKIFSIILLQFRELFFYTLFWGSWNFLTLAVFSYIIKLFMRAWRNW